MSELSESLLVHRLSDVVRRTPGSVRPVALSTEARWVGGTSIDAGGQTWVVREAPSPLAMRVCLAEPVSGRLVVLTPLGQDALGLDVLARLEEGRVLELRPWAVLMERFRATAVDPRIAQVLAQPLLEACPPEGFDAAPGGYLDLDLAWQTLARHGFGFESGTLDLASVLGWLLGAGQVRFSQAAEPIRAGLCRYLADRLGPAGALALGLLSAPAEWPARLVLAEATARAPGALQVGPRALLAHLAGLAEAELTEASLGGLAAAVDGLLEGAAAAAARQAEQVFGSQRAVLGWSRHTAAGREARAERLATALAGKGGVEAAAAEYVAHHAVPDGERALVAMAVRLHRWLHADPPEHADFAAMARWYAREGGHVDRARQAALAQLPGARVAPAVRGLLDAVKVRREAFNQAFARRLQTWPRGAAGGVVPVEQVVAQVVAPLASRHRVLLLVVDGLSFAVAHELVEDLPPGQWVRVRPPESGEGKGKGSGKGEEVVGAVATVPSVTELARTALFTGQLGRGAQAEERAGLAAHPALLATGRRDRPPVVFHEADLRTERVTTGGEKRLANGSVSAAIRAPEQAVVAVVVNAVDKELSGSSQYVRTWNLSNISGLRSLLDEARDAGRVVVLTADHGHVWFDGPVTRPAEGGSRWRVGAKAEADEAVFAGLEGPVAVPVIEDLRYRPSAGAGTHGGATPQEVLVPLWVLWPASLPDMPPSAVAGVPRFWDPAAVDVAGSAAPVADTGTAGLPLFEVSRPTGGLATALEASKVFAQRRALGGGAVAQILELVDVLDGHGGRLSLDQLSARLGVGVARLRGLVATGARMLNVDGFQILTVDEAERAVRLAADLLRAQFEVGG